MEYLRQTRAVCVALGLLLVALLACKSGASSSAPIRVSAEALFTEYQADQSAADSKYKGKTLVVTGTVGKVNTTSREVSLVDGQKTVQVYCLGFAANQAAAISKLKPGQQATVKGTCRGRPKMMGMSASQVSLTESIVQ